MAVLVDSDTEKDWVKRHKVEGVPTLVWTDTAGTGLGGSLETAPVEEVLEDMEDALYFFAEETDGDD